jgi:hypothetical protein
MTNTQARLEGSDIWNDYGNVSMYSAAKQEAVKAALSWLGLPQYEWPVEVRRENDDVIPASMVRVKTFVVAEVLNPRQGAD